MEIFWLLSAAPQINTKTCATSICCCAFPFQSPAQQPSYTIYKYNITQECKEMISRSPFKFIWQITGP